MATEFRLQHENGLRQKAFLGFWWTSFLFGPFPAMLRGDWLGAFAYLFAFFVFGLFTFGFGAPVMWIAWACLYNRWHARRLVMKGFKIVDAAAMQLDHACARVAG